MDKKSRKRSEESSEVEPIARKRGQGQDDQNEMDEDKGNIFTVNGEELEFEDPFGDDFEDEDYDEDEIESVERFEDDEDENVVPEKLEDDTTEEKKQVWRPGIDKIPDGEELEYDPRAYVMYHSLRAEWPCLSFDFLKDNLGEGRLRFPMTMYLATGSQADVASNNKITLLKLSDLNKTGGNDSDEESDDDDVDDDPTLEHVDIPHNGGINRIRSMPQKPGIIATMADTGYAHIYDATAAYQSMLVKGPRAAAPSKPLFSFKGHRDEGFAIDWSPVVGGRLATGDCAGAVHVWNSTEGGSWNVENKQYLSQGSVEDIQWSPTEPSVFITGSSDKKVRIWDTRGSGPQITIEAHSEDVNVISWNRSVAYLLASGSDDGSFKIWDLRTIKTSKNTLANFNYHKGPITSIEWAPHDESVIALASADDQLTIWDLSVEAEETSGRVPDPVLEEYPAQLLFIHQGQHNTKELHHHPQIPGVIFSTAEDGFNVFKPAISVSS